MKAKACFVALLMILAFINAGAQDPKLVWLGLDFTAAKLVGDPHSWRSPGRTQRFLESLNDLMVRESPKYDIAWALNERRVDYEIQVTREHNRKLSMEKAVSDQLNGHRLDQDDLQQIVNYYDFGGIKGTGIMFIVETFNKPAMEAVVWITFVDLENNRVLKAERVTEEPAGIGVRNFWAGSIYKILKHMKKRDYEVWQKQYTQKS